MKQLGMVLALFLVLGQCLATEDTPAQAKIKQQVQAVFPEMIVDTVSDSPVSGLYQLTSGPVVAYASNDGRYLVAGDLLDLEKNSENRNVTENARRGARVDVLKKHISEMIIYRPKVVKAIVTVFTDLDCGYCVKLHKEVSKLNNLGIEVRYMAFPRQGIGSPSYTKMESIWCANDPKEALTTALHGGSVPEATCHHDIAKQLVLGRQFGVVGTPTLVFADGTVWGGYLSASELAKKAIQHSGD